MINKILAILSAILAPLAYGFVKRKKSILAILSAILAALAYGFVKGKKSIEILENEQAAKQVQEKNKYIDEARKLSDVERDKLVQKYTKRTK
jgi:apolipoprotein N-acyltransferase